ncbi:MAG TPA: oligoendopeptidase F [Candidatus Avanaerovorax faecigallinarum]|nr:oligoendopeptidase F [Candidatus Avanaerovorax faecigallinarum]
MGEKNIKSRNDIDPKYKWKIELMYPDRKSWEGDVDAAMEMTENFLSYQGRLGESSDTLLSALKDLDAINMKFEKAYCYAKMKQDEDNRLGSSQEMLGIITARAAEAGASTSFFSPELLSLSEEKLSGFLDENPELKAYDFVIKDSLRMKEHVLSEKEESILARLSEVTGASDNIQSMLSDADLKFGKVKDSDGKKVELSHGNYINFMESPDRKVRKQAFTKMYEAYKNHINTFAAVYGTSVKADVTGAVIRGYDSARQAAMSSGNIPESVYDNLIEAVHENLPVLHRYITLKKKILGVKNLKMYDVYAPLVSVPETEISFEEAVEMMKECLAPLGEEYISRLTKGVESGWIDVYETPGKTSGAYSFGSYDSYPYILMNYTGKLQDVLTLVHECGHSMHSSYTREAQPFTYGDYSIFVAEVASTVNESLTLKHLLDKEKDVEMRKYLLFKYIEEFRATVFRQTMFAEFELAAHRLVEEGGSLTAQWLCETYDRLNTLYFGEALSHDDMIQYEWARIPHFYRAYYVYQYATGFSAATAIADRILSEGATAVEDYIKFLKTGSSMYPVDELKIAGVDMTSPEPVRDAMKTFEALINELESLL